MARWHNIRVRGDLYEMVAGRAQANRRSVAQMTDVLLTRALGQGSEREDGAARGTAPPVPASEGFEAPAPARAPVAQQIQGQTTVDEMLASCPQCAGGLQAIFRPRGGRQVETVRCEDCGWVREPK
jgi:predicted RNA-binding Zn-ribbon protein involved in translation (DUF1610 family)